MSAVLIWLLVSLPDHNISYAQHVHVVERFTDLNECQRVVQVLKEPDPDFPNLYSRLRLRCVQARIAVVKDHP